MTKNQKGECVKNRSFSRMIFINYFEVDPYKLFQSRYICRSLSETDALTCLSASVKSSKFMALTSSGLIVSIENGIENYNVRGRCHQFGKILPGAFNALLWAHHQISGVVCMPLEAIGC